MNRKSVLYVLGAGFCWGIIGVFSKPLAQMGFSSFQITAIRSFVTVLGLMFLLFAKDKKLFRIQLRDIWMFLGTGIVSIVFFNVCYFQTIKLSTLGLAAILLYTAPFFVVLFSSFLYHERITKEKVAALFLAFVGCILVTGFTGGKMSLLAFVTGIGSGLGYACYSLFGNAALKKYEPMTVTFYTFLFASIGILPLCRVGQMAGMLSEKPMGLVIGVTLGLISTLLPFVLYTEGLKNMEAGKASILAFSEPFVATLAGIILFQEKLTLVGVLGLLLLFTAICLLNRKKNNKMF